MTKSKFIAGFVMCDLYSALKALGHVDCDILVAVPRCVSPPKYCFIISPHLHTLF